MIAATNSGKIRFVGSERCPVCGGADDDPRGNGTRCFGWRTERMAYCTREDHGGSASFKADTSTYAHHVQGPCPCGVEHSPAPPRMQAPSGKVEATYIYRDADGANLFRVVKKRLPDGDKTFYQQRWQPGSGGFEGGLKGMKPVLYHLPELMKADPGETVYVVEGEKDVENLEALGFVATSNPMGAEKWRDHYSDALAGRRCVLIQDNDDPGRRHIQKVAASLHDKAASVRILELPDLAEHGDASDWLAAGGTADRLRELAEVAPEWVRPAGSAPPPREGKAKGDAGPREIDARLAKEMRTDMGNGARLASRAGGRLRYCKPWEKWLVWDGRRYALDTTMAADRMAKEAARMMFAEAATIEDDGKRGQHVEHAKASQSRGRLKAMLEMAASEPGVPILVDEMDRDGWLLNVANGTIDLKTGRLKPHDQADVLTQLCPVEYDAHAKCPLWESTLELFFAGDPKLIAYWQRVCGYALTGVIRDHVMPVAYGQGSNGKSTILGTLMEMLGPDYAMKAPPDMLMAKAHDSHPTDKADLFRKRLVVAIETAEGRRLDETMVKELTGGDRVRARRMREDYWEFSPTHTLIMATNHRPTIRGTDNGIWRRLKLVPFTVKVDGGRDDKRMSEKLRAEFPGILAWCVRGCLAWQEIGLQEPESVAEATADYREEQDVIGGFLADRTLMDPSTRTRCNKVYEAYKAWAEAAGERVISLSDFGKRIGDRGIGKSKSNGWWYIGVGLKQADDPSWNVVA
jgi:putative DNA primase/helicase